MIHADFRRGENADVRLVATKPADDPSSIAKVEIVPAYRQKRFAPWSSRDE
jgi:hypothetical protein